MDIAPIPAADGMILMPIAIQDPHILCSTLTDNIPTVIINPYWSITCTNITPAT